MCVYEFVLGYTVEVRGQLLGIHSRPTMWVLATKRRSSARQYLKPFNPEPFHWHIRCFKSSFSPAR